jgi:hypothetical protein
MSKTKQKKNKGGEHPQFTNILESFVVAMGTKPREK